MYSQRNTNSDKAIMLMNIFRELWEEHIMWTRSFIISTAANLGDLDLVTKRLLRNPTDFANVLKMYYGYQNANEFKTLFEQHLLIAADLVNSAKAGDTTAANTARKKWYENAEEIANFLSSINPYWSKKEWQMLLNEHLRMTEAEATARLQGRYADDIAMYDSIETQALQMADYMSSGITKQFL